MNSSNCPECGSAFVGRPNKTYCHPRCRQRAFQRNKHADSLPTSKKSLTLPLRLATPQLDPTELERLRLEARKLEVEEAERKRQFELFPLERQRREEQVRAEQHRQLLVQQEQVRQAQLLKQLLADYQHQQAATPPLLEVPPVEQEQIGNGLAPVAEKSGSAVPWILGGLGLLAWLNSGTGKS
jgi:hypothetical protein